MPYVKINSKCIKALNLWTKIIKLVEENVETNLHDAGFGSGFLNMTSKALGNKKKNR